MRSIQIFASKRFLRAYYRSLSITEQGCAEGAIHDFVARYHAQPESILRHYARVQGINHRVLEIDTSGTGRLLGHFARNQLTLIDVGKKAVVPRCTEAIVHEGLLSRQPAPAPFWPGESTGFFLNQPGDPGQPYGLELSPDWLYFLDEEQHNAVAEIEDNIEVLTALLEGESAPVFFVVGGPGTGKSSILLNLLKYFAEQGYETGIYLSDNLAEYVSASAGVDIDRYRSDLYPDNGLDVLLVDDPPNKSTVENLAQLQAWRGIRVLVIGFDPLQLEDAMSDAEFENLVTEQNATVLTLRTCYRQKEVVGKATKHAADRIAASTPFLAARKIEAYHEEHAYLTELANNLRFTNPAGYTKVYEQATMQDLVDEINRIRSRPGLIWKHWYPLLVVEQDRGALHEIAYDELSGLNPYYVTLGNLQDIKGMEFQHVFLCLSRELFERVDKGFQGTGRRIYQEMRLLRIPFSRAKDSLVTFVLDKESG